MSALLVLTYDVHDLDRLVAYRERASGPLVSRGARLVSSTAETVHLAEADSSGAHTVVLEFADLETALAAYHSAEYQEVVGERLAATTPRVAMVVPVEGK